MTLPDTTDQNPKRQSKTPPDKTQQARKSDVTLEVSSDRKSGARNVPPDVANPVATKQTSSKRESIMANSEPTLSEHGVAAQTRRRRASVGTTSHVDFETRSDDSGTEGSFGDSPKACPTRVVSDESPWRKDTIHEGKRCH